MRANGSMLNPFSISRYRSYPSMTATSRDCESICTVIASTDRWLAGDKHAHSDVDLMIVGDVEFADIVLALSPTQERLRREINPTVLTHAELATKLKQRDGFIAQVWKGPKLWLIGEETGGAHEP